MNIAQLGTLIEHAQNRHMIPVSIMDFCAEYYQPYYHLLYLAGKAMKGYGKAIELGVNRGMGVFALCASGIEVIGIDHTQHFDNLPNFRFLQRNSLPVPDEIKGEKISVLHVDTEHSESMARGEFEAYKEFLTSPAIVLFDDLHAADDSVLEYFSSLPYPKIQDDRLHPDCGYGVILYE